VPLLLLNPWEVNGEDLDERLQVLRVPHPDLRDVVEKLVPDRVECLEGDADSPGAAKM